MSATQRPTQGPTQGAERDLAQAPDAAFPAPHETLVDVAARRARARPDDLAYVYLDEGAVEAGRLTYGELDAAARRVAAALLAVAGPRDRAILVYETGIDFVTAFYGCLYAGLVAVPIPAPEPSRLATYLPRLKAVAADCDAQLLLGNAHTHALLRECRFELASVDPRGWVDTAELARAPGAGAADAPPPPAGELPPPLLGALAYLQYTSGSTSTPKGVMISHRDVARHLAEMCEGFAYDAHSVSVSWMPHFHDYGLIEGFLLPVYNGTPAYFMSPTAFIKRPLSWLGAIGRYRGTHTQAPNFAYRYCVRKITGAQKRGLDLSSLRSAGNASEPIHPGTSDEFYAAFAECGLRREGLRPAYGLAEATLIVSCTRPDEAPTVGRFAAEALGRGQVRASADPREPAREVAACGRALPRTEIAIVDPETLRRAAPHETGEVWVSSEAIAEGYWSRPEESEETFRARIAGEGGPGARTYLRTGDLGFLHDGQLYVTSRRKDLIIIRGLNHHPQDVEWTVQQAHDAFRPGNGAAFAVELDGEERLGVVQELKAGAYSDAELDAMVAAVSRAVIEAHGVAPHAVVLIEQQTLLKTSSGKVQRRASRDGYLNGTLRALRTWTAGAPPAPPAARPAAPNANGAAPDADARDGRRRTDELLAWLRDYAERRVNSRLIDERRCVPPHVVLDFGNRGLFGLQAPRRHGGLALGHADTARVYQQLGAIDLTLATLVFLHNTNGLQPILRFAPEALQDELLPALASGRELAAFALSEPGAGSNLGALASHAARDGDGRWRLHGVKRWNGSAWAGVISVFVRLLDDAGRPRGLAGFVVRQSDPGVQLGPEALTMGIRGIMQNSVRFDGTPVTRARMLGEPGRGMRVAEHVLSHGRLGMAAVAVGGMRRCAQLALRYASRRAVDTGLLLENPQLAARLSELAHRAAVDEELVARCAATLDAGSPAVPEVAMLAKVSATDGVNYAADLLVQALGGRGYMENNLAPQIFRDARMLTIGEGANESLLGAVGRSVRMTDTVHRFLAEYRPGGGLPQRLTELAALLERQGGTGGSLGAFTGSAAQLWRDATLGRLASAALAVACAESLVDRGAGRPETLAWARLRFERLSREAERGADDATAVLTADALRETIDGYRAAIGDVEPLAPDVEWELDPMLYREERWQAEHSVAPRTSQTD